MYTPQLSVYELKKHWRTVDGLVEGDSVDAIPLWHMPPWNDLCSELDWKLHLVEGGYFRRKHHGFCGVYRLIGLASEGDLIAGSGCLNRISASISGASAGVRLPCGVAAG